MNRLMTMLADADSKVASTDSCPIIIKKVRHELIGSEHSKHKFFRRSRVYMSIKVLLQHNLTIRLGAERGKFLYKVIMMRFFNELCEPYRSRSTFNIDLLGQMIAKMARRIEKLANTPEPDRLSDEHRNLYEQTIERSKLVIKIIRTKIDTQIRKIQSIDEKRVIKPLKQLDFEADIRHDLPTLDEYLTERISDATNNGGHGESLTECQVISYQRHFGNSIEWPQTDVIGDINANADAMPSTEHHTIERRLFWTDFENHVLYSNGLNTKSADTLRYWALEYLKYGQQMYTDNQLSMSRMVLVYLMIIETLDELLSNDNQYKLLRKHASCVNPEIIDALHLPQHEDMKIASELQE